MDTNDIRPASVDEQVESTLDNKGEIHIKLNIKYTFIMLNSVR